MVSKAYNPNITEANWVITMNILEFVPFHFLAQIYVESH